MKRFHPWLRFLVWKDGLTMRNAAFLQRRPHRTFRRTRRRDYVRSLKLPGYWHFTWRVWRYVTAHKTIFMLLIILYTLASLLLGGITNQETYQEVSNVLNEAEGGDSGGILVRLGGAGVLLASAIIMPGDVSNEQQIYLTFSAVMLWLTTVWLLRDMMAGRKPRLRDGLYSAGAPIISSLMLVAVALLQLVPVALLALAYTGLSAVGLLTDGMAMLLFWSVLVVVMTLVLYWMTPTFLALVIVTLPGMYPAQALKAAGDIVVGRRLRILYRILWLLLFIAVVWVVVMIPTALLGASLSSAFPVLQAVPLVPLVVAFMSSLTSVWVSAYIYILYRKIVDDDASPA